MQYRKISLALWTIVLAATFVLSIYSSADVKVVNAPMFNAELQHDVQEVFFGRQTSENMSDLADVMLVPSGETVGIRINTDGVMVLGTGLIAADGKTKEPARGILKPGDIILYANGQKLEGTQNLIDVIEEHGQTPLMLEVKRNGAVRTMSVTPIRSKEDDKYKIGVWVRDSTQGIGTITFYNLADGTFGSLGHGIMDVDTRELMSVRGGVIMESNVREIRRGEKGFPGEIVGEIYEGNVIGTISSNTNYGVYGRFSRQVDAQNAINIALRDDIHEGEATIFSNISGEMEEYEIYIEKVNHRSTQKAKGMVIRITDERLLAHTNGIVQGMSGSPIIQNGRLIGAVTHVFVNDPARGYGIFIENMLGNN